MKKNLNEKKLALSIVTFFALFILILGFIFWAYSSLMLAVEENKASYYYTPDEALSAMKTYSVPLLLTGLISLCSFSSVLKRIDADHTASDNKAQKPQKELGNEIEHMSMSEIDDLVQNALNSKKQ